MHGPGQPDRPLADADTDLARVDERILVERDPNRLLDGDGRILLRRLDGDAVDHVARTRHPPGDHAGEPLRSQARHASIEDDDAVTDLGLDRAARGLEGIAHELELAALALVQGDLIE